MTAPDGSGWAFGLDDEPPPVTTVRGPAEDFCLVAARRLDPAASALTAECPDAAAVLAQPRTVA